MHFAQLNAVSCSPARTASGRKAGLNCVAGGVSGLPKGTTAGFVLAVVNGVWGTTQVVPRLSTAVPGSAVTTVSCPFRGTCGIGGYCAAGGQRMPALNGSTATALVIDEAAGHWGKPASLYTGPFAQVGTNSLYAISCAAPRDCAAGGDIAGFSAFPYAFFASEKPVQQARAASPSSKPRAVSPVR